MTTSSAYVTWPGIGQAFLETYLIESLERGSLPRAVIFVGPQGLAKGASAQWLALQDLCTSSKKPCGTCQSCLRVLHGEHPQCIVLRGKDGIGVDDVRPVLQGYTRSAFERHRRWLVITDVERMSEQAANLLLKFLEELPTYVQVVMTTSQPAGVLATVLSRVTAYYWKFVSGDALRKEGLTRDEARYALGRPEWRLSATERQTDHDRYLEFNTCQKKSGGTGLLKGKIDVEELLQSEEVYLREQLLSAQHISTRRRWTDDNEKVPDASVTLQRLERYLQRYDLSDNVQGKILYDNLHLA